MKFLRAEVENKSDLTCPFCGETEFDQIGLKSHLLHDCNTFHETEDLQRVFTETFHKELKKKLGQE